MNKQEFLAQLRKGMSGLPCNEREERLMFYSEMIDDRMEEGLSEEEAVFGIGDAEGIISQILTETPLRKLVKERIAPNKRMKAWEILLLVLGSPIWFSLLVAAVAVVIAVYVSLWSVVISLWAVFGAVASCGIAGMVMGAWSALSGNGYPGAAMLCAGFVCVGLSIFLFCGCRYATKGIVFLTKEIGLWIKKCFVHRGEAV